MSETKDAGYRDWLAAQPAPVRALFTMAARRRAEMRASDDTLANLLRERELEEGGRSRVEADRLELEKALAELGYIVNDDGRLEAKS